MEKTVAIGDVHGLDSWKDVVEAHPESRIIFLGDYLDPYFYVPRDRLLDNLREIIALKKSRPEGVVLLLGNHDLHYFSSYACKGTRYDCGIAGDAYGLFTENSGIFQYAFQDGNCLFTHAGVSQKWFEDDFHGDAAHSMADQLNHPEESQISALFRVGYARGGERGYMGGIFWADESELYNPLHGYVQVVGHNRVREVTEREGVGDSRIIFCDCLRYGLYLCI